MSRRNIFILIGVILIALVILFALFAWLGSRDEGGQMGEGTNFFARFNPFSRLRPSDETPDGETPDGTYTPGEELPGIKLRKVSSMPVAGFGVFQKERYIDEAAEMEASTPTPPQTEFAAALRYVARSNGNIYQTFADKLSERKFSGTFIPKVYEAYFGNKAEAVIMRYLKGDVKTIQTFVAPLPKESLGSDMSQDYEIRGSFLPENISEVAISPDSLKIFYLLPVGEGVAGITANILGDKKVQVFDSQFTEWLPQWPRSNMVTLNTKPSYNIPGYLYAVNTDKKDLNRVLAEIPGLTTLVSPDGKKILYTDSTLTLRVYDTASRETFSFTAKTLPEKCVWSGGSENIYCSVPKFVSGTNYPDLWYKGQVNFSDEIWKLDTVLQNAQKISELVSVSGAEDMDNWKLQLDEKEKFLFFVNKKDSYLWELILD